MTHTPNFLDTSTSLDTSKRLLSRLGEGDIILRETVYRGL